MIGRKNGKTKVNNMPSDAEDDVIVLQKVAETVEELERGETKKARKARKGRHAAKRKSSGKFCFKIKHLTRRQRRRQLCVILGLFGLACVLAVFTVYRHHVLYPGIVDRDTLQSPERGLDYVKLSWTETRNTDKYTIFYKQSSSVDSLDSNTIRDSWQSIESRTSSVTVDGLKEGKTYLFAIRPESLEREGSLTKIKEFTTKKSQAIKIDDELIKFTSSKPFKIEATAETNLKYESSDTDVADVNLDTGYIEIKGEGIVNITVTAQEDTDYTEAVETVEIRVLDIEPVDAGGTRPKPYSFYSVNADNCEVVTSVSGAGGADVPQGMACTGDMYTICFGMYGPTRLVSYDLEGGNKDIEVPDVSLGHPNGFTYNPDKKWYYCVRGNSSKCVVYDVKKEEYRTITMPVGCSGIGYDKGRKKLYTSARGSLVSYNPEDYSIEHRFRRVNRSGTEYMQDCEACDGLLLNCVSGSSKRGLNYIDIYDMENVRYIGTITCDLGEVESAVVNKDGYLEILSNSTTDYIWRTDLNIKKIAEEVKNF